MKTLLCRKDVTVAIVTYGDRSKHLAKVLEALFSMDVQRIVIVDNNSSYLTKEFLKQISNRYQTISIINNSSNIGSSGGFSIALLSSLSGSYIWLLDDDNVPFSDALDELISAVNNASDCRSIYHSVKCRLASDNRISLDYPLAFPSRSSFCEFNILDIHNKVIRRLSTDKNVKLKNQELQYGPYSGIFLPREAVLDIGLPNSQLYLYCDDSEWTFRLTQNRWKIFLLPTSRILDIDTYWGGENGVLSNFSRFLMIDTSFRSAYTARNQVYFDYNYWKESNFLYNVNKLLYIFIFFLLCITKRKIHNFSLFVKYISAGEAGRLGYMLPLDNSGNAGVDI